MWSSQALAAFAILGIALSAPAPAPPTDSWSPPRPGFVQEQSPISIDRIPTRYESTVLGRRLLAHSSLATIATVFPHHISFDRTPSEVHDVPISQPEYIASCEEPTGNPTLLALRVSTSTRNAAAGSNVSISVSWWDEYVKMTGKEPWSYANLPRLSLIGHLEEISMQDVKKHDIVSCFTSVHADSKWWLPGDKDSPHSGLWMRLIVEQVYWIGGFGDRAYIGWFDPDEWRNVTTEEWGKVRLPGEQ